EVVFNEQSLPLAWRSHDGIPRGVELAGCRLSLLEVWNAVERIRLHGNREPGRGATAARGKLEVADMSDQGPSRGGRRGGGGDRSVFVLGIVREVQLLD